MTSIFGRTQTDVGYNRTSFLCCIWLILSIVDKDKGPFDLGRELREKAAFARLDSKFAFPYTPAKSDLPANAFWRGTHPTNPAMAVR